MEQIQVRSLSEAIKALKLSRSTFYRYVDQGRIRLERVYKENELIYNVYQKPSQPKAALEESASEREATLDNGFSSHASVQPVETGTPHKKFLDEWIEWRDEGIGTRNWSASHKKRSVALVKKFFEKWEYVTPETAEKFLLETPVIQYSQRRCKHAAISSFAKFLLQKKRLMDRSVYFEIKALYPKKPKDYKRDIKIIHQEDIGPIMDAVSALFSHDSYKVTLLHSLIIFLSETGVRISEAGGLIKQNLCFNEDLEQAYVHLPEHITKNGKERYVPFSLEAQKAVREYFRIRPDDVAFDQVFLFNHRAWGYTTLKPTSVGHIFEKVSEQSKVPFTAHSFRHYRITAWANDPNISITDVQYWAGHETLTITQGYIHVRGRQSVRAAFSKQGNTNELKLGNLVDLLDKLSGLSPEERKAFLGLAVS